MAFYDALADNESAREVMGDGILKQIVRDLTKSIKNNISVDWAIRESVQAKMRMIIKRLLKKYGYPPDKTAEAVDLVMARKAIIVVCCKIKIPKSTCKKHSWHGTLMLFSICKQFDI